MVENNIVRKKGVASPEGLIFIIAIIVIGIISIVLVINATAKPFKQSATTLSEDTKEIANISLTNLSIEEISYFALPIDECGNGRGSSLQAQSFSEVNLTNLVPFYPEFYECIGVDCCKSFVYLHILNFGRVASERFVHLDFYVTGTFLVNGTAKSCSGVGCCPPGSGGGAAVGGNMYRCSQNSPYTIIFYYSATGRDSDWHKFYQANYNQGRVVIVLPIAAPFQFVKVMAANKGFIPYITGEIIPWQYTKNYYFDVCNRYYPQRQGENFLYNKSGSPLSGIDPLTAGGYILNISGNSTGRGLWEK